MLRNLLDPSFVVEGASGLVTHLLGLRAATGYTSATTAETIGKDLSTNIAGRNVLITGVSPKGLGLEAARVVLVNDCANLIVCTRNLELARSALVEALGDNGAGLVEERVHFVSLDLASLASVRKCAAGVVALDIAIDTLILNSGIMACPFGRTEDGLERQFGVNVVGHHALASLLMPLLVQSCANEGARTGRIVSVGSMAHQWVTEMDLKDLNFEAKNYDSILSYGYSKLGNLLFARELQRRIDAHGYGDKILAVSLHPGVIPLSNLARNVVPSNGMLYNIADRLTKLITPFIFKTVAQGAATHIYTGFSAHEVLRPHGGAYFADCTLGVATQAGKDGDMASKLWLEIVKLTKEDWGADVAVEESVQRTNVEVETKETVSAVEPQAVDAAAVEETTVATVEETTVATVEERAVLVEVEEAVKVAAIGRNEPQVVVEQAADGANDETATTYTNENKNKKKRNKKKNAKKAAEGGLDGANVLTSVENANKTIPLVQ